MKLKEPPSAASATYEEACWLEKRQIATLSCMWHLPCTWYQGGVAIFITVANNCIIKEILKQLI